MNEGKERDVSLHRVANSVSSVMIMDGVEKHVSLRRVANSRIRSSVCVPNVS